MTQFVSSISGLDVSTRHISALAAIAFGILLVGGAGFVGFLPVLGFWMIPLGLIVLSIDLPWARRGRRRFSVWFQRRYPVLASKISPGKSQTNLREGGDSS